MRPGAASPDSNQRAWRQAGFGLTPTSMERSASSSGDLGKILVGTSAWSDLGSFYPPGTKSGAQLPFYATQFPVVEINATYYAIPSRKAVEGWVARTPDSFVFDVKPPRALTSTPAVPKGEAPEPDADIASAFAAALEPLAEAGKLGAVTFQFLPSYRNTPEHHDYLKLLPELFPGCPISVEFRRLDWLDEEHAEATLKLLTGADLSFTMVDERRSAPAACRQCTPSRINAWRSSAFTGGIRKPGTTFPGPAVRASTGSTRNPNWPSRSPKSVGPRRKPIRSTSSSTPTKTIKVPATPAD